MQKTSIIQALTFCIVSALSGCASLPKTSEVQGLGQATGRILDIFGTPCVRKKVYLLEVSSSRVMFSIQKKYETVTDKDGRWIIRRLATGLYVDSIIDSPTTLYVHDVKLLADDEVVDFGERKVESCSD